ncbi:MAG: hypothetical protein N2688_06065 [Burkholderiaceae bacterium]|nr:hypothetical protein [Burkholderiaceae bacterium]
MTPDGAFPDAPGAQTDSEDERMRDGPALRGNADRVQRPITPHGGVPAALATLPARAGSWTITDDAGDILGFVAIDRLVAGRGCGGIRAGPRVTLQEIERIARVMTLKCAFAGLAAGGAKGGVIMPDGLSAEQRRARLRAFGVGAAALLRSGVWSHGADMGTTDRDIAVIRHAAGLEGGTVDAAGDDQGAHGADVSSGTAAGWTVALAAEAALQAMGIPLHQARVSIQGAGAVGRAAAAALAGHGARIVGMSTVAGAIIDAGGLDVPARLEAAQRLGDAFTAGAAPADALFELECDALLLCAGTDSLGAVAARALRVKAVVCGGNIAVTPEVERDLHARGLLVVPDFVASGGGVLGSTLVSAAGVSAQELQHLLRRYFKPRVEFAIARALSAGGTVAHEAEQMARRLIAACEAVYTADERPDGLLPERLAGRRAPPLRWLGRAERRLRGSRRLAMPARWLRRLRMGEVERVLAATLEIGRGS